MGYQKTRVSKKKYYRITFQLESPLALGSGENDNTDKDLIKDKTGKPYIPASSIAGIVQSELLKHGVNQNDINAYFGYVDSKSGKQSEGVVVFYDATIFEGKPVISVRDSVALDEYKTAQKGSKFDMEVLEPGVRFVTYVEQDFTDAKNTDMGKRIAECFAHEEICFGGKSMRGYGKIGDVKVAEREFDLSNEVSMNQWIDFDLYSDSKDNWSSMDLSEDNNKKSSTIRIQIKQQGGISIRRYTTKVSTEDETQPDMEQLTIKRAEGDHDETPVIPGTSWAGAFRHRMKEFGIDVEGKDSIFGTAIGEKSRSKICFGETQLTGGNYKTISRNSIDRFSGGAVETALFTERTYYDGKGELEISWNPLKKESMPENEMKALAASLADLHYGFLAIGGETSIGRGLFQIEKINNESVLNNENIYELILKEIEGAF